MKKKAFQYLMILLLGTTAAFADWSEEEVLTLGPADSDICISENQATFGKDSSEEEIILGPTDTNDDTSYLEYLDIPFDLFWDLTEKFYYINAYVLLGEEAAERSLESMREIQAREAAKYIAPALSVATASYMMYRLIQTVNLIARVSNPAHVMLLANQILSHEPGEAGGIIPNLPGSGGGG